MEKDEEQILDQFEDEPQRQWYQHWSIVFGPVVLFIIGMLFRIQHWPRSMFIIALALFLILLRSFVFFFIKPRPLHEWIYFIGRIALISVLVVDFAFVALERKWLLTALTLFAIGVMVNLLRRDKGTTAEPEQPEDDY